MAVLNTTQLGAGIRAPARKTGDESKESTGGMFDHSGAWIVLTFFFFSMSYLAYYIKAYFLSKSQHCFL